MPEPLYKDWYGQVVQTVLDREQPVILSREDFIERIIEPMVARLLLAWKPPIGQNDLLLELRMRTFTDQEIKVFKEATENDLEM